MRLLSSLFVKNSKKVKKSFALFLLKDKIANALFALFSKTVIEYSHKLSNL